jgi:hypothetical protein
MKLEIRNISITSLIFSSVPVVVCAWGVLGGLVTFIFVNNPQLSPMGMGQKLMSIGFYALLYAIITAAAMVFIAFMYNVLTGVVGLKGVEFDIEEINGQE